MQIALQYGVLHSTNFATSISMNICIYVTPVLQRHTASGVASYDTISRDNSLSTWFQYHAFEISGCDMICCVPTTSESQHGRCIKRPRKETTEQSFINRKQTQANYFPWNSCYLLGFHAKKLSFAKYTFRCFSLYINPYPTAFPYGNGMVLHFYQQQESSTTKTVHKVINKRLKAYV